MSFHLHLLTETVQRAHPVAPMCVEVGTTAADSMRLLKQELRGSCMVCRDGVLVGVFTERDALRLMSSAHPLDAPVEQVMSAEPVVLMATDSVSEAIAKMSYGGFRQMPIVDLDKRPIGILKVSGILRYLVEHFPKVIYTLPPAPHHSMQQREGA